MREPDPNPYAPPQVPTPPSPTLGTPVVLRGEIGLEVQLRAHDLASGNVRFGWQNVVIVVLLPCVAVLMGLLAAHENRFSLITVGWLAILALLPVVMTATFLFVLRGGRWQLKRAFAQGKLKPVQATWTISDEGIHTVTDTMDAKETWTAYESWQASDDMLLLYGHGAATYVPLAREFCHSEHDWERLREFIRAKLPEKQQ